MQKSVPSNLEVDLKQIEALAAKPVESPQELAVVLKEIYQAVFNLDFAGYDPAQIKVQAPALIKAIFGLRVGMRDRIPEWQSRGFMTLDVQRGLRDAFRLSRYGGDMIGEIGIGHRALAKDDKPKRVFTGINHNTVVHPKFDTGQNIPFQSGDVLLVRGFANNSAAIARIGDVDSQFSHVAIIHIDEAGKHWVVEALIEDGAVITPFDRFLAHAMGRAVLFRHKDAALAAKAAQMIHDRVLATTTEAAEHIPYDFSMRLKGRKTLFCAKLIQQAFLDASGGKYVLPTYKTRFDRRDRAFLRAIGVRAKETFAPGDIDLEPQFDLVAEWQDYRATSALRRQDMIMTKFFQWMEERGWKFEETPLIRLVAILGRLSSGFSDDARELMSSVMPKVPANMSRSCIATIVMLHKSAEELIAPLRALEDNQIRMTGRPLHPREILSQLERLRETSGGQIGYLTGPV